MGSAAELERYYTYSDYAQWDDDKRYELIDGQVYLMSAPIWKHQYISGGILSQLLNFLKGKPCMAFAAPFDVRLNADAEDDTVVQPDITVVCNRSKLDDKGGLVGTPDMVVEILSPSTASRDRIVKFNKYLQAGVREYWIVDPESKTIETNILCDLGYVSSRYGEEDDSDEKKIIVPVSVLKGCDIDFSDVFPE